MMGYVMYEIDFDEVSSYIIAEAMIDINTAPQLFDLDPFHSSHS
jgi:hypothetical protein